ncbi:hypothetical protein B0T44_13285 [Nocardia donostiensis]|uniref:Uncharacterized protein n=2 Tax=Nocardia donostiensis TaxID=1538463 RepID=A0A1V2TBC5_9NOCA|nr:hypothetical protein B0T46_21470 [Nocardia donostiensis]OQS19568.1 hypothetical protein B0T44_13285 [Nocardia donostiensis]
MILDTCYSLHEVAYVYSHRFGFPVEMAGGRPSLVIGDAVGAVTMPQQVGWPVRDRLRHPKVLAVPVISHPRHRQWIFLVHPAGLVSTPVARVPQVCILDPGSRVWLPTSDSRFGWYWVDAPKRASSPGDMLAPAQGQVLRAAKSVLDEWALTGSGSRLI